VNAAEKHFEIWQPGKLIKSIPIKGLYGKTMPFGEYVELMRARGTLRISAVCAHPSSTDPGSPVDLNPKPAQREAIGHSHQEFPTRGGISLSSACQEALNLRAEPGKPPEEAQRVVLSPSLSSCLTSKEELFLERLFTSSTIVKSLVCLLRDDVAWRTMS
jgi:hypothetical protein